MLLVLAAAAVLAGCSTRPSVQILPLTTQEYAPKPAGIDMPMFASVPPRAHLVVAEIRVEGSESQADSCITALQQAGREVGADALVLVHWVERTNIQTSDNYGPRGRVTGTSVTATTVPTLIARAVVWMGNSPLGEPTPTRLGMRQLKR
jgi:hypothetical protein